jgi:predicted enzyme related to lactoylglutathione lyase
MPAPVVHLELHTGNLARACDLYSRLCGWEVEQVAVGARSYQAIGWHGAIGGGIVECARTRPAWLPYVEVRCIEEITDRARRLGATVLLDRREGPLGWRTIVAIRDGAEVAFWQPKR